MFIYNVSENIKKCLAMYVKSIMLKAMIIAVQKIHLNKIHFLKDKIFQFELKKLKSRNVEMLIYKNYNVVEKQFNFVAETVDCKQLISYAIVKTLIIHEMIYNSSSKFIVKLIKILQ